VGDVRENKYLQLTEHIVGHKSGSIWCRAQHLKTVEACYDAIGSNVEAPGAKSEPCRARNAVPDVIHADINCGFAANYAIVRSDNRVLPAEVKHDLESREIRMRTRWLSVDPGTEARTEVVE
jgi:hypothetical protein